MTRGRLVVLAAAVAVAAVVAVALGLHHYVSIEVLEAQREALRATYAAQPVRTSAIFFVLYTVLTALSVPELAVLTMAGGAIFGVTWAVVLVSFASTLGATLAFLGARFLAGDWVRRRAGPRLAAIDAGIAREGALYLFALRLVPLIPFVFVNLAMGLTRMPVRTFYWVSQLGMLPGTAVFAYAGAELGEFQASPRLFVALALLGLFPLVAKRMVAALEARKVYAPWHRQRPARYDYNLVVIGAGSAGLVTSNIAAATQARVALVEAGEMGGDCLNTGCVPSKALVRSAKLMAEIARAHTLGLAGATATVDFPALMARVRRVIADIAPHDSVARYTGLGVDVVRGRGCLTSPWTVEVQTPDGVRTLTTRAIVIATGARPAVPAIPGLDTVRAFTSDTIWSLDALPSRLLVLGGGPVGCELAQAFARLGSAVTLVEAGPRLLSREDAEVSALIAEHLTRDGVRVLTNHTAARFLTDGATQTLVAAHAGHEVTVTFDAVLVAVGRVATTTGLGLEDLGIAVTAARTIDTDDFLQTRYPNIYACGDVASSLQFTHLAAHQARYASVHALFGSLRRAPVDMRAIPRTTFTDPEVARVGLSADEAHERGVDVAVTTYPLRSLDRAVIDDATTGFITVVTRPGSDTILGVTCVGAHAGELIAEFTLAMTHGLGLNAVLDTVHAYPTFADANKQAAGAWRRSQVTRGQQALLQAYHAWRRGAGGLGAVLARLPGLVTDRREARPPDPH